MQTQSSTDPRALRRLRCCIGAVSVVLALVVSGCNAASGSSLSWSKRIALSDTKSSDSSNRFEQNGFDAVDCLTTEACVALIGTESVLLDGTTWSRPVAVEQISADNAPSDLACVSATHCVTFDGLGRVLTYDGDSWSRPVQVEPASNGAMIEGIACASASFCAIVDSNGDASFFDGSRWTKPSSVAGSSGLAAISCPAIGVCFALDSQGDEAYRYAHGRWAVSADLNLSTPDGGSEPNTLNAISCGDTTFCIALDDFGDAFTYNGQWAESPHTFDDIELGNSWISCTAERRCVIVDDSNHVIVYEKGAWSSAEDLDNTHATLDGISCVLTGRCIVVDDKDGYFIGNSSAS